MNPHISVLLLLRKTATFFMIVALLGGPGLNGRLADAKAQESAPEAQVTAISAGTYHACALKNDGSIYCWGENWAGESTPTTPNSGFVQVSASDYRTCAVRNNGSIDCWGGVYGATPPPDPNSGFTQVSLGYLHTCALKNDGSIACWGENPHGEATPPDQNSGFTQVSAGQYHTCALKTDGSIACWGEDSFGQSTPPNPNSGFTQVSAGDINTCALKNDGSIACWGAEYLSTPPTPNSGFVQLSTEMFRSCAVRNDGSIACWGENLDYPPATNSGFVQVSVGRYSVCALKTDGAIVCWGPNISGEAPTIYLTPPTLAGGSYGTNYHQALTAFSSSPSYDQEAPYTFEVYGGALPPGITLSADGVLSGTPTQSGEFQFTLRALNIHRIMGTQAYTMQVEKATLTVKADDQRRKYGSPNPPLTFTISGYQFTDDEALVSGSPALSTGATTLSPLGTYAITIGGSLSAENYDFEYVDGTLTVFGLTYLPAILNQK